MASQETDTWGQPQADENAVASANGEVEATQEEQGQSAEEMAERARTAGWTEKTAIDYAILKDTTNHTWNANASKYEWKGEYGDVGPEVPELEKILFHDQHALREGPHRNVLDAIQISLEGGTDVKPIFSFDSAGLHPVVARNASLCGYTLPTPIQAYTIPAFDLGVDIVAISQTGSGKTAAYMIPIVSKLMGKARKLIGPRPGEGMPRVRAEPLVLIIVPTRELAIQVFDEARRFSYRSMLRPCVAYGGLPIRNCLDDLGKGCDILIGTPGRLCDLMNRAEVLSLSRVKYTVLDEADELLNQDWQEEIDKLLMGGDSNEDADHQFMMFSATFPSAARELAREYMANDYLRIKVGSHYGQSHRNIRQNIIYVDRDNKQKAVYDLLFASEPARTLIFCNAKIAVDMLDDYLYNRQLPTTSIHADHPQREREDAIRNFRSGRTPILIATGVTARGLDVANVAHVINYDLPSKDHGGIEEYLHRIGRTARMGHQGLATSFFNEDRDNDLAEDLVAQLLDNNCEVPDFLTQYIPADGKVNFDDAEDGGEGDAAGVAVDGWGTAVEDGGASAAAAQETDGW